MSRPFRSDRAAGPLRGPAAVVAAAALLGTLLAVPAAASVSSTSVVAGTRCVAGQVVQVVQVTNGSADTATVAVSSPHGSRTFTLDAGRSASTAFSTRRRSVPAGEVVVSTTVAGATSSVTGTYAAGWCGAGVAPVVTAVVSPPEPDGEGGWWTSPVTVALGLPEGALADVEHRVDGGDWLALAGSVLLAEDGRRTLEYRAVVGGTPVDGFGGSLEVALDTTEPDVVWGDGVEDGSTSVVGQVPPAPGCTAVDVTSGPGSCEVSGYSSEVGSHTLTATASDVAGNVTTRTRSYTVTEPVSAVVVEDLQRPVLAGQLNPVLTGRTVLLQFRVLDGSRVLADLGAVSSVTTTPVSCGDVTTVLGGTTDLGTQGLRHRGDRYSYAWRTDPAGVGCVALTVTAAAGASTTAYFRYEERVGAAT